MNVDIENLEQIIKLMANADIAELTMKKKPDGAEELIIRKIPKYPPHMEGCHKVPPMPSFLENPMAAPADMTPPLPTEKDPMSAQAQPLAGNRVESPLVGTFYTAPAPGENPFVNVGDTVKKGQVLGIVEAMKLMNEIECEFDGTVTDILVKNGDMVEYGQPLFIIQ